MKKKGITALSVALALSLALPAGATAFASEPTALTAADVLAAAEEVYDAFIVGYAEHSAQGDYSMEWSDATFRLGSLALSEAAKRTDIFEDVFDCAYRRGYRLNGGEATSYLEALGYSSVYAEIYEKVGNTAMLDGIRVQLDHNLDRGFLEYSRVDRLWYVGDACILLSAADSDPAYAQLDFVSYSLARTRLFDFGEGLWYRDTRYVYDGTNPRGQSFDGKKIFFSRSNAMAYASLARRLAALGEGDEGYATYCYDFLAMSASLKERQREDGFWNADLGESVHYRGPESTGTAGFLYGISAGIALGILDRESYFPVAEKAYRALLSARTEDGAIGYCLPATEVDARHYAENEVRDRTNEFGTGMFLLGACAFAELI